VIRAGGRARLAEGMWVAVGRREDGRLGEVDAAASGQVVSVSGHGGARVRPRGRAYDVLTRPERVVYACDTAEELEGLVGLQVCHDREAARRRRLLAVKFAAAVKRSAGRQTGAPAGMEWS
jgi:hypothetical protein